MLKHTCILLAALAAMNVRPAIAGGEEVVRSTPHVITCWNNVGATIRRVENDVHGPYFNRAGSITFLDKNDHRMHRLSATNCDESWEKGADY